MLYFLAPTAPPQNVSVQIVNSTSLTVSWDPPPLEDTNGFIRQYILVSTENETLTITQLQPLPTTTQVDLNSLHPYYTYTFRVAAETVDLGPFSNDITVQLPEDGNALRTV